MKYGYKDFKILRTLRYVLRYAGADSGCVHVTKISLGMPFDRQIGLKEHTRGTLFFDTKRSLSSPKDVSKGCFPYILKS